MSILFGDYFYSTFVCNIAEQASLPKAESRNACLSDPPQLHALPQQ